jgi:hypothetical protein
MASYSEIADEIDTLASHFRPPLMDTDTRSRWLQSWCEDLAGFEIAVVRIAFRDWRRSGNTKFPTPGQLLPLIRAEIARFKAGPPTDGAKAWEPLSDAEYDALSLNEKIRHHRILASRASGSAGPQWGATGPLPAEQMPTTWHSWKQRARHHLAEAERLKKVRDERALMAGRAS